MSKRNRQAEKRTGNPDLSANYGFNNTSLMEALGSAPTASGTVVTPLTAQQSSAVFACINLLAGSIAWIPKTFIYTDAGKRREAPEYNLYDLLRHEPNPEMSSFTFFELLMRHLLLRGNFYAQIITNPNTGAIKELWALHPDYVLPRRDMNTGTIVYDVITIYGKITLPSWQMLHIKSFSENGLFGMSIIQIARQTIGLTISADEFGERFFQNNSKPSGFWKVPVGLSKEEIVKFKDDMKVVSGGLYNAHRLAVVQDGFDFQTVQFNQKDSQFLETRQFQIQEIARIFGIPPHMIGELSRSTNNNIEQQAMDFGTHTLNPWIERIRQEINRTLVPAFDRGKYSFGFDLDQLYRADMKARYESYASALTQGWQTRNEIRAKEKLNPVEGGDILILPLNYTTIGKMIAAPAPIPAPAAPVEASRSVTTEPETRAKQKDARQIAKRRLALRNTYKPLIHDAASRCIKREVADVRALVSKTLSHRSDAQFEREMTACYEKLGVYFRDALTPVLKTYFSHLADACAEEIGVDDYHLDVDTLVSSYLDAFIARHNGSSQGQLNQLMNADDGMDPLSMIEQRLDEWLEKSPDKITDNESIRGEGFLFKMMALACGVQNLRWNASATACPICQEMNGKVVGVESSFMDKGGSVNAEDDDLTCNTDVNNPPLHRGCSCFVSAD